MAVLDKIVKLFRLGQEGRGGTEAEMLAAVTTARQLMIKHKISQHDVNVALNKDAKGQTRVVIDINEFSAYTRKIRNLARYDEIVAYGVAALTDTEPVLRKIHEGKAVWTSMIFIGEVHDTALASALFHIWLPEVRSAARRAYGPSTWSKVHTSYAIGYATRILDRARETRPAPADAGKMALVVASTQDAIARYKEREGFAPTKRKGVKVVPSAYAQGYVDGDDFKIGKRVIA